MVPPTGLPIEIEPRIGGDLGAGDTAELPDATEIGLGLRERVAPGGPVDSFLWLLAWADGWRPMADPVGAGDSISRPLNPRLVPASASTASSSTAGTVWSRVLPCERCERRDDLWLSVCA